MQKEKLKNLLKSGKFLDFLTVLSFVFLYGLLVLISTHGGEYVFGSLIDFTDQHYTFPEYMRTLFYESGDLFPDFAFNLGAGVNIYSISYYGLLNPIVILSYLFPFISMCNYLIIAMAMVVISSAALFYFYLKKSGYGRKISYLCSLLFFCAAPLTFHAHRHIMFVNYMPFLVMGLYGVDKYVYKKKSWLLVLSITLMIFTSYYFSISGMVALFIFGCFKFVRQNGFDWKTLFGFAFPFATRFIISVLIGAVLLLPTFHTLFMGRTGGGEEILWWEFIKPSMKMLYSRYSMGLTSVSLVASVYMLFSKRIENIILCGILLGISIFPFFNYVLNGFLYINAKSLIPFVPLALINTADFMRLVKDRVPYKKALVSYVVISALVLCMVGGRDEEFAPREMVNDSFHQELEQSVEDVAAKDSSYRINTSLLGKYYTNRVTNAAEYKTTVYSSVFSEEYRRVCRDLFENPLPYRNCFMISASNNPIFQTYMGEKYIYTEAEYDFFYEPVETFGDKKLYKNPYALPIGYATSAVINEKEFGRLEYQQKMLNILGKAVIDAETNSEIIDADELIAPEYSVIKKKNVEIKKTKKGFEITAKRDGKMAVKLDDKALKGKLLLLSFDLTPVEKRVELEANGLKFDPEIHDPDLKITINGTVNKLTDKGWKYYNKNTTFVYALVNSNNLLKIQFAEGVYKIKNLKLHAFDPALLEEIKESVDPFVIDGKKTKGDIISGSIDVKSDGYFMLSVPYDKGFTVKVDGKEVEYYKANEAFIGFDISAGKHNIEIEYNAPLKKEGMIISICGILLFVGILLFERRRKNGKDNDNSTLL